MKTARKAAVGLLFAGCISLAMSVVTVSAASFHTNSTVGWQGLVNERLLTDDKAATEMEKWTGQTLGV